METKIVVPSLGESVIEATVARWLKKEGDSVAAGETLVELETDKVNLEVGAERAGRLVRIQRREGEDVKVGDELGVLGEAAEQQTVGAHGVRPQDQKLSETVARRAPLDAEPPKATPSARRMIQEQALDIASIEGTGPGKQITKQDVENHLLKSKPEEPRPSAPSPPPPAAAPAAAEGRREERVRMTRRRRTIAQRLIEAQQTAAMLTTYNEIDMSAVMDVRKRRKELFQQRYGTGLGIVSFFVKASIAALKEFPALNAELQGEEIAFKHYYDIGVAIGAAEGLVVPVLRDADHMTFAQIEQGIKSFAQKSEAGTLSLDDLRGGTFTITNGGVFGSLMSMPILNPPQVGILGLHKIEDRPVVVNGQVVVRSMMYVALTYDHRIVDGRESVQFLARIKQWIEDPAALFLES